MKVRLFTIVLDGMPWIACQLPVFNKLPYDWSWHIAEGTASPVGCTSWCKPIKKRLSVDGTTDYLSAIKSHPRVTLFQKEVWNGKLEMVNACCRGIDPGDVVIQVDSDEIWTARQLESIVKLFNSGMNNNAMLFRCRYFVGPNLIITSREGYGNHSAYEWRRAWRASAGFQFTKHEPPEVSGETIWLGHTTTESIGLVFDHYAYATRKQVEFKQEYYGYKNAVANWQRLQEQNHFPIRLRECFDWVTDNVEVNRVA
jgi:hypothetical protein